MESEYLSWDCANRTLAHVKIRIEREKENINSDLARALAQYRQDGDVRAFVAACDMASRQMSRAVVVSCDVVDLLGKKVKEVDKVERARALRKYLTDSQLGASTVVIELQPSGLMMNNTYSNEVSAMIMYHYANCRVEMVSPKVKNRMHLGYTPRAGVDAALCAPYCADKNATRSVRSRQEKNHAVVNFVEYLRVTDQLHVIAHLRPAQYNHCADAFWQAMSVALDDMRA